MEPEIKWILRKAIEDGFLAIKAGTISLTELFPDRTSTERSDIASFLNSYQVKVLLADPRDATDLPCISIIRANESESNHSIGEYFDTDNDDPDHIKNEYGTMFANEYNVEVWTNNADVREILYRCVKEILFMNRLEFAKKDIFEQRLSGSDQQGNISEYIPEFVYVGRIAFHSNTSMKQLHVTTQIEEVTAAVNTGD